MPPLAVDVDDWAALMDPGSALSHAVEAWRRDQAWEGEPSERVAAFNNYLGGE